VAAVISLTTDFGLRDPYVAEMKAAILSITGPIQLVDLTHQVEPHDVTEAALALEVAVPFFPASSVHLAVVDPGVGTLRRGIVLASGGHVFVGPDNGLFTPFLAGENVRIFELRAEEYRRREVSRTFHGRDIFAPAAAHVALGVDLARFGPPVTDPVRLSWPEVRDARGTVAGVVVHVDRFGNLVTSIRADAVPSPGSEATIAIGGKTIPLVGTYGDLPLGGVGALVGSGNRLEVAVREGSAAAVLRVRRGTPVVISRTPPSKGRGRSSKGLGRS